MPRYEPTEYDVKWAKEMMRVMKHGGVVWFPGPLMSYVVDHLNRTLTLEKTEQLSLDGLFKGELFAAPTP